MEEDGTKGSAPTDGPVSVGEKSDGGMDTSCSNSGRAECAASDGPSLAEEAEEAGIRASKFMEVLNRANGKLCWHARKVLGHYPSLKGRRAEVMKASAAVLAEQLDRDLQAEYQKIMKKYRLVHHLNRLDALSSEPSLATADGTPAWRPSEDPLKDVDTGDAAGQEMYATLLQELNAIKNTNQDLQDEILACQATLEKKYWQLETSWAGVEELESTVAQLPIQAVGELLQGSVTDDDSAMLCKSPRAKRKRVT